LDLLIQTGTLGRAEGKSSITAFRAVYYMVKGTLSFLINRLWRFG